MLLFIVLSVVVVISGRLHLTAAQVAGRRRGLAVSEFTRIRERRRSVFGKVWFRSVRFH